MNLIEHTNETLLEQLRDLGPGEEELIRVSSDLNPDGRYGTQWVVVTTDRVLVHSDGATRALPAVVTEQGQQHKVGWVPSETVEILAEVALRYCAGSRVP